MRTWQNHFVECFVSNWQSVGCPDDFDQAQGRMASVGVEFVTSPRTEPYGKVAVFLDVAGNRWDLIGPS